MTDRATEARIHVQGDFPAFDDLPWHLPLADWPGVCDRIEEVQRGLSRHVVEFVNYGGRLYAVKELPHGVAKNEYECLLAMAERRLPVVRAVGYVHTQTRQGQGSALITAHLESSLPYRTLFMRCSLAPYRASFLDAMAGLLVQLHLAGLYWGDCSLSNTLFRRDAGALQAYLVDAETAEIHPPGPLPPNLRYHELEIMEESINGDLADLYAAGLLQDSGPDNLALSEVGASIRLRYQRLWEEIRREEVFYHGERYKVQERIRALNKLGFSIGEVMLQETDNGEKLRLRLMVTDRNFHHDQLNSLTGLDVGERQAQVMMNEILELKARLSQQNNRSTPLSVAANHWLEHVYLPVTHRLRQAAGPGADLSEQYIQVLEHKWYLSEQAQHDVGHFAAAEDYVRRFANPM